MSSSWPGYEPLYLARDKGWLDPKTVQIHELPSSNISYEAFGNGSADLATLTLDETLSLLAQGRKARILAVLDISHGADAVMAHPSIRSLSGLKGKRIGIVNIPLGAYMLTRVLEKAGLAVGDVTVVALPEDKHERAYRNGEIDAAITFEPFKTRLAQAGAGKLFDSSEIPGEIFDVLLVHEATYTTRRDDLCHLVQRWFDTLDFIQANPDVAAAQMGKRLNMDGPSYLSMLDGLKQPGREENRKLLGGADPSLLPPARRLADIMLKLGQLPANVDPSLTLAPEFESCAYR